MSRRVTLPQADDLFRPTGVLDTLPDIHVVIPDEEPFLPEQESTGRMAKPKRSKGKRAADTPEKTHSGRVKHDEKMTVYISSDELLDLEQARLTLRRALGTTIDRGRLVRAAVSIALADLEAHGEDSAIVKQLTEA